MNLRRFLPLLLILGLLLPALSFQTFTAAAAPTGFANTQFEQVWSRADLPVAQNAATRSWLWGPQPGQTVSEQFAEAPGGSRVVQYFDKARMEVNAGAASDSQWATTTGLLVVELVSGRLQLGANSYENRAPAAIPVAGDANPSADLAAGVPLYSSFSKVAAAPGATDRAAQDATGSVVTTTIDRAGNVGATTDASVHYSTYSKETDHNIPDVFQRFMQSQGLVYENGAMRQDALLDPVYVLGYPISEAYWATVPISGKAEQVLIQLYQRRVLTYIPSYDPAWQVQMGNVGRHYYTWRYETPQASATPLAPTPTAIPAAPTAGPGANDQWIHIAGNQLFYQGQPVKLKGTNFWLHLHPFVGTWAEWNGFTAQQELKKAKELGVNTIRIGIPYDNGVGNEAVWGMNCGGDDYHPNCDHVKGSIVNYMTQLLQIADGYNMKVIFALFDWSDKFPVPNSAEYQKQMNYLQGIVAPFVNDDRVIGWDLHNEPENYGPWTDKNGPANVINWLSHIASAVRAIDKNHSLTVGMGNYQNLWLTGSAGQSILDIVDFVSFHCYDAGHLREQMDTIAAHTSKPILLEEFGWPSGPAELSNSDHVYDENTQQFLYRSMLGDAKASPLVGVVQWTLTDNPIGTSTHFIAPTVESWFGLVDRNGNFKPAAATFRDDYPAPLLPSQTHTNVPFTKEGQHP